MGIVAERAATVGPKHGIEQAVGTDKSARSSARRLVGDGAVGMRPRPLAGKAIQVALIYGRSSGGRGCDYGARTILVFLQS